MKSLNLSQNWVVLAPGDDASAYAAAEISRIFGLLRRKAGLYSGDIPVESAVSAPDGPAAAIILNAGAERARNGYSWRAAPERVEIFGASGRGLVNGAYRFLGALGVRWPEPGVEILPDPGADGVYALTESGAHQPSEPDSAKWRRLVIGRETPLADRMHILHWGIRSGADALILPLEETPPLFAAISGAFRRNGELLREEAERAALSVEAGGWDLTLLIGHRVFAPKELFRMEGGRRLKTFNFCPTSPAAIARIKRGAERVFAAARDVTVFHLWPDRDAEDTWCSCPTCRAFSRREQNRIAVRAAADVLARINPAARVSYFEYVPGNGAAVTGNVVPENTDDETGAVSVRSNMFGIGPLERFFPGTRLLFGGA
ncbi:MAG: hypothetical protein LBC88_06250 [Spirochaetaceae bacterium]|nr:hypothetical protein [Spirochaetaceae bacterium]